MIFLFSITFFALASCGGPDFSGSISERVQTFYVSSSSSAPNLLAGDRILVDKQAYRDAAPSWGDIVVCRVSVVDKNVRPRDRYPNAEQRAFIFRIVGLPGDRIRMQKGDVYINGQPQSLSPIGGPTTLDGHTAQMYQVTGPGRSHKIARLTKHNYLSLDKMEITVEPDRYFVLGDNRDRAYDSRFWGTVHRDDIVGKGWLIYFSTEPGTLWLRFSRFFQRIHETAG
ncbi:MAG: signal peptidase I [Candidatus Binatia bacterium]